MTITERFQIFLDNFKETDQIEWPLILFREKYMSLISRPLDERYDWLEITWKDGTTWKGMTRKQLITIPV